MQLALVSLGYDLSTDGDAGAHTVGAVKAADPTHLWVAFVDQIENHYQSIARANPKDQKFLAGWLRRADETIPA